MVLLLYQVVLGVQSILPVVSTVAAALGRQFLRARWWPRRAEAPN